LLIKIIVHEDFWRNLKLKSFNFQQLFFFSPHSFGVKNLTEFNNKISKSSQICTKKTKISKIFPTSLLKMTKSRQKKNIAFANSRRFHKDHHSVNLLQFSSKYLLWMKCGHCWMSFIHLSDKEQGWVNFLCIE